MSTVTRLTGLEILDSRGRPTVQATCELVSGAVGTASVPSGSSTGAAEAHELRDGDPERYLGLGCRQAVDLINTELHQQVSGQEFGHQRDLDDTLIDLDGTPNKSRLGANTLLSISLAFARAAAAERGQPLYEYFATLLEQPTQRTLPWPIINLFSGGKHAGGQVPIQDLLVLPASARTMDEALSMTFAVYQAAAELSGLKYGMRSLTADEGGLAPPFESAEAMLTDAVDAIRAAGFRPGEDVLLAVDVAASHFYRDGRYHLSDTAVDSGGMIRTLIDWTDRYPVVVLEDGLAENDWQHWPELVAQVDNHVAIVGDDLLCTNPTRIQQAINTTAANALLLKVNQIGTVTEGATACVLARSAGWRVIVSARSGETEDNWLADLAVGWSGDFIKIGSITQSERLSKYNRLLVIENITGRPLA